MRAHPLKALIVALPAVVALAACGTDPNQPSPTGGTASSGTTSGPATASGSERPERTPRTTSSAGSTWGPATAPTPAEPESATCPTGGTEVHNADELTAALASAAPGTVIRMADGTYAGRFKATAQGTQDRPIVLCGGRGAVIDAGSTTGGYALHLDGAAYWRLVGLTVTNGQKGVMLDGVQHTILSGLEVHTIGDEAIHLRNHSSDNVVRDCVVHDTGQRREKFGEGVYVGSAQSNWPEVRNGGGPDHSDRNVVWHNTFSRTTSEAVDAKEGTRDGVIAGNTFDGASLSGADSWVDVKGVGWVITDNSGQHSTGDGYQTHEILPGEGTQNVFARNQASDVATKDPEGVGYGLRPARDNVVFCDNKVDKGTLATVPCR